MAWNKKYDGLRIQKDFGPIVRQQIQTVKHCTQGGLQKAYYSC